MIAAATEAHRIHRPPIATLPSLLNSRSPRYSTGSNGFLELRGARRRAFSRYRTSVARLFLRPGLFAILLRPGEGVPALLTSRQTNCRDPRRDGSFNYYATPPVRIREPVSLSLSLSRTYVLFPATSRDNYLSEERAPSSRGTPRRAVRILAFSTSIPTSGFAMETSNYRRGRILLQINLTPLIASISPLASAEDVFLSRKFPVLIGLRSVSGLAWLSADNQFTDDKVNRVDSSKKIAPRSRRKRAGVRPRTLSVNLFSRLHGGPPLLTPRVSPPEGMQLHLLFVFSGESRRVERTRLGRAARQKDGIFYFRPDAATDRLERGLCNHI